MSGMEASRTITAGRCKAANEMASKPVAPTPTTSNRPLRRSWRPTTARTSSASSTRTTSNGSCFTGVTVPTRLSRTPVGRPEWLVRSAAMARSVLLVDDVPELRSVLRQAIRLREGFTVVAEAEDGVGAITAAARHQPDVIVLDLGLPDLAGHEVLTRLRTLSPSSQIVVYTGSVYPDRTPLAREVEAFVTKDHDVAYLVDLLSRLTWRRQEPAGVELGPDTRRRGRGPPVRCPSAAASGVAATWSKTPNSW